MSDDFALESRRVTCPYCGTTRIAMISKETQNKYCNRGHYWAHLRQTSFPRAVERFWANVEKTESCWLWKPNKQNMRYGRMMIAGVHSAPHRFAYEMTYGRILPGLVICHKCDNRICVRPDHLFVGTYKDNMADAMRKGRVARGMYNGMHVHPERRLRGTSHPQAKLSLAQVYDIILFRANESGVALAREFGVRPTTISNIRKRRVWEIAWQQLEAAWSPGF